MQSKSPPHDTPFGPRCDNIHNCHCGQQQSSFITLSSFGTITIKSKRAAIIIVAVIQMETDPLSSSYWLTTIDSNCPRKVPCHCQLHFHSYYCFHLHCCSHCVAVIDSHNINWCHSHQNQEREQPSSSPLEIYLNHWHHLHCCCHHRCPRQPLTSIS